MGLRTKWMAAIFIFLISFMISPSINAIEESNEYVDFELNEAHIDEKSSLEKLPLIEQPTQQQEKLTPSETEDGLDGLSENSSEETPIYVQHDEQLKEVAEIDVEQNETSEAIHTESDDLAKKSGVKTESFIRKSGHIIWDDEEDKEGFHPDSVEVRLYQNNKKMKKLIVEAGENNDWTYVFDNLPKADAENKPYDYQVDVVRISNYLVFVDEMIITLVLAAGGGINELPDPPL